MNIPESAPLPNETRVWDPVARIFHRSPVAAFIIAWLTFDLNRRTMAGYHFDRIATDSIFTDIGA